MVIPTYNEKDNIINIITKVVTDMKDKGINIVMLVMDDSSPDGTADLVREYINTHSYDFLTIELKVRAGKQGLATAYTQGFRYLIDNYDPTYIMSMDADMSHDPKYIAPMLSKMENENLDLMVGSRYVQGGGVVNWGPQRKLISRFGSLYAKSILGSSLNDMTGGFNIYRSSVIGTINLNEIKAHGYLFNIEMKHRMNKLTTKIAEHPIVFVDRVNGKSKMSRMIILEAFTGVWGLRQK